MLVASHTLSACHSCRWGYRRSRSSIRRWLLRSSTPGSFTAIATWSLQSASPLARRDITAMYVSPKHRIALTLSNDATSTGPRSRRSAGRRCRGGRRTRRIVSSAESTRGTVRTVHKADDGPESIVLVSRRFDVRVDADSLELREPLGRSSDEVAHKQSSCARRLEVMSMDVLKTSSRNRSSRLLRRVLLALLPLAMIVLAAWVLDLQDVDVEHPNIDLETDNIELKDDRDDVAQPEVGHGARRNDGQDALHLDERRTADRLHRPMRHVLAAAAVAFGCDDCDGRCRSEWLGSCINEWWYAGHRPRRAAASLLRRQSSRRHQR